MTIEQLLLLVGLMVALGQVCKCSLKKAEFIFISFLSAKDARLCLMEWSSSWENWKTPFLDGFSWEYTHNDIYYN